MTREHSPARYAYALLDLDTNCILDVEATPTRFSAEVAAPRAFLTRAKAKLGIAASQLAVVKAYGNGPLLGG